jgi:hypothetical protein
MTMNIKKDADQSVRSASLVVIENWTEKLKAPRADEVVLAPSFRCSDTAH